ncbi:hypothetical protein DNTS_021135 [Danionella cerebrum]|uniref:Uncharacterized protein n=1 Tax=Danionella cerebrum TaxID=2873325 RepID=A0A553QVL8_9TELE|nr:hypothetical protein DNTS_021135 [Danionella translucida]
MQNSSVTSASFLNRMDPETQIKSAHLDRIVTWGNQDSIRPLSRAALQALPSPRIKTLAQHKRDFCLQIQLRKEEEEQRMKMLCSSSHSKQYESIIRLATPKTRGRSAQEVISSPQPQLWSELDCAAVRRTSVSPRILQLAKHKNTHPDFISNRENVQTFVSFAAQTAKMSPRLEQLSLPRLRENAHYYKSTPPESPIRPVSRGTRNAITSARIQSLSTPKPLSKDYTPPWHS